MAAIAEPADTVDQRMAWTEQLIRWRFAGYLSRVELSDTAVEGPTGWVFVGEYALKDLPLTFPFSVDMYASAEGDLGEHPLLSIGEIGGVSRFYALAQQFHRDFPGQPSFYYEPADVNGYGSEEPWKSLLEGRKGPSVIVYERDYGNGQSSAMLGLYSWDGSANRWVLLHRGLISEPG
jgi:hypothetical protein